MYPRYPNHITYFRMLNTRTIRLSFNKELCSLPIDLPKRERVTYKSLYVDKSLGYFSLHT